MNVPVLETERLRLRAYRLEDFPDRAKLWADPEVVRYTSGTPMSESDSWARMLTIVGLWEIVGYGYWALEEKASGRYIGEIGYAEFKREIIPSISGIPEIGWIVSRESQGKGYATEGVRAALAWGDARFPTPKTVCIISPENTPSFRVAEKSGYREFARSSFRDKPIVLLSRG